MLHEPRSRRSYYLIVFFFLFSIPLFLTHLPLLNLPFFWDELGQFIPTALDLLRDGSWVAHSTVPNVHPPGVEAYLVLWYKLFGFSIPITRVAMLLFAGIGLVFTFLLAIELSQGARGAPAFLPPLLLLASPLFYTQSMMAQLDMPAMVFTLLALFLFLRQEYAAAAAASVLLVLIKETGLVTSFIFFLWLVSRRSWKPASFFIAPALALAAWLVILHRTTGHWLGDPGFAQYNVAYALNPVRMAFSLVRHVYYVFVAEYRWIGSLILWMAGRRAGIFGSQSWRIAIWVGSANLVFVSVLGGAELERYLLPVLPIFYVAVSIALVSMKRGIAIPATTALFVGLIANLFWNPPYPFPYENNYAMVDFVRLQQLAAEFVEDNFPRRTIATAWPYTAALTHPEYGFVTRKLKVVETNDFHLPSILSLPASSFDTLIVYTRTWSPYSLLRIPVIRKFLTRYYDWRPVITDEDCIELGLRPAVSWSLGGQLITVYVRQSNGSAPISLQDTRLSHISAPMCPHYQHDQTSADELAWLHRSQRQVPVL